jgi:proline iminopeptidase
MSRRQEGFLTLEDGVELYFEVRGGGAQTVVAPNGFYWLDELNALGCGRRLIVYDLRNRGRSSPIADPARLARGVVNDVDDLEKLRRHFAIERLTLVAHSYVAFAIGLYAMRHPRAVERLVQVGPSEPFPGKQYPPHLTGADETQRAVLARLAQLQAGPRSADPVERCHEAWRVLRELYVTDPADAPRADWGRCELANERAFMAYWMGQLLPSLRALQLTTADFARVEAPALVVHGSRDRSAPYGGGREWALLLPAARLLTVEGAGHAPWIEARQRVLAAIDAFLAGEWPHDAERVTTLEPRPPSAAGERSVDG